MGTSKDLKKAIDNKKASTPLFTKWRTVLGLVLMYFIIIADLQWVWGIFFIIWLLPDLKSGKTYFMDEITIKDHKWLYWTIMISWIWMALYFLSGVFSF